MKPFRNAEADAHAARIAALQAKELAEQASDPAERKRHFERSQYWLEKAQEYEEDYDFWEDEDSDNDL